MKEKELREDTCSEEDEIQLLRKDFFSYYRRLRSNLFSDTEIVYETKLTKEVFDLKLQQLSQDKKQSEFETFALSVASRLVTPNIKPQTGPDGGGDGKVDGETYPVDKSISDKWWVSDGCTGDQKWAIAISVQKTWEKKVTNDTKKIVGTKRGYTKILFFSNQKIKSSKRCEVEDKLTKQYSIPVSIFDGNWFSFAVFEQGCLDLAVDKMNFSDEYRKKTVIIGPNDKQRSKNLKDLEDGFLTRSIEGLNTQYIDDLLETCLLSRGLGKPRVETEGRFDRALREAKVHGTPIQTFNIIYNHAWTTFFWFNDINATYEDYLKMKDYASVHTSVHTIELLTNILTNIENVTQIGLFDQEKFITEVEFIKSIRERSDLSQPCQLFIDIYISEHRLFQLIYAEKDLSDEIRALTELLEKSVNYVDISFDAQSRIIDMMGRVITNNEQFEKLVDKVAEISSARESDVQGALIHFSRAQALMEKMCHLPAIKHLGYCVQAFLKEGYEDEYIKTCGLMGIALSHLDLPYSAEAYLVKSASFLMREFYSQGTIPQLLMRVISQLCGIELILGRLVMYLNWRELLYVIANNRQEYETEEFIERDTMEEGGWCCHLAAADFTKSEISILPDIFERFDMPLCANYLKYVLGYKEEVNERFSEMIKDDWTLLLQNQPIHEQFLCALNLATDGEVALNTMVHNCRFYVTYENSVKNQLVAETFLASVETLLATFIDFELVIVNPEIRITIKETNDKTSQIRRSSNTEYIFSINHDSLNKDYWRCFSYFISHFMSYNTVSNYNLETLIKEKQDKEKIIDRVSSLMQLNESVYLVLGNKFKYSISQWQKEEDKIYTCLAKDMEKWMVKTQQYTSSQQKMTIYNVSTNMQWWDDAIWKGMGFIIDQSMQEPPLLALLYENISEGKKIVKEWKDNIAVGKPGVEVYLIKGIDKNHPSWYRVCLSPNIPDADLKMGRYFIVMCRKHTMTPNNTYSLDALEKFLPHFGKCKLMALAIDNNNQIQVPDDFEEAIEVTSIVIIDAWRITDSSMAVNALEWDDDPLIPESEKNTAPILEVLENLRKIHDKEVKKQQ